MPHRFVLLALLAAHAANAEEVVRVKDGDSLVVVSGGRQVDVRLADIDAPEYRQPHGEAARSLLRSLVDGKTVDLQLVGGDAYRRIVAHVFVEGVDVNAEMVGQGLAWVRRAYDPAPALVRLEDEARAAEVGLWSDANPTPPWEWRKSKRGKTASTPKRLGAIPQVRCGTKRYCREMSSCEEAIAHLQQCAVTTIDGDKDGVPCEALCRGYSAPPSPAVSDSSK